MMNLFRIRASGMASVLRQRTNAGMYGPDNVIRNRKITADPR